MAPISSRAHYRDASQDFVPTSVQKPQHPASVVIITRLAQYFGVNDNGRVSAEDKHRWAHSRRCLRFPQSEALNCRFSRFPWCESFVDIGR
jgi:hypothetical protein